MQKIEDRNLYVDFSDVQVVVYQLTESGYWSHEHMNPMFLELDFPPAKSNDEKWQVMRGAMEALGDYFRYETPNKANPNAAYVLQYAKEYAEVCRKKRNCDKGIDEARTVEDIFC